MRGAFASFHYHAVSLLAVLAHTLIERSRADPGGSNDDKPEGFVPVDNNECEHIHEEGGSWIHDPHWFSVPNKPAGEVTDETASGEGCPGGLMYMCEPKWSAEAHPEDLGNGWSIPMFLDKERYEVNDKLEFDCNDQIATTRGGLNGGVLGKFSGTVTWECTPRGWEHRGICKRARYCRARTGEIKLSPSRSLEETSLALIHVKLEVHEMMRYETQWFPCDHCHAHDVATGQDVSRCSGKVLLRCDENDQVVEVDNLCTAAQHKKKSDGSLLEIDKSDVSVEAKESLQKSKTFLHGQPASKKAHSDDNRWRSSRASRRHEA